MRYSSHGLHALKTLALLCQVIVHAHAWTVLAVHGPATPPSTVTSEKLHLILGAMSMMVPMTAAAVFRASLPISSDHQRIQIDSWRPYIALSVFLGLLESLKHAIVYGLTWFFAWDVLHLIAVSLLLIIAIGRRSIQAVMVAGGAILLLTPVLIDALESMEVRLVPAPSDSPTSWMWFFAPWIVAIGCCYVVTVTLLWVATKFEAKHKVRLSLLATLAFLGIGVLGALYADQTFGSLILRNLWIGVLTGTRSGMHIWGLFPWSGMILLGFSLQDLVMRGGLKSRLVTLVGGLALIGVFYFWFAETVNEICSPRGAFNGFSGDCFNRTEQQTVLILGLACVLFPLVAILSDAVEKPGLSHEFSRGLSRGFSLEPRLIRMISRSILTIYLFETTALAFFPRVLARYLTPEQLMSAMTFIAFGGMVGVAWLTEKMPKSLHLTVRKNP